MAAPIPRPGGEGACSSEEYLRQHDSLLNSTPFHGSRLLAAPIPRPGGAEAVQETIMLPSIFSEL